MSRSIPKANKFAKSAIFLLIIAAAFYGMAQYLRWGLGVNSIAFPVSLREGGEYSGDFQAKWNVHYEIRLDGERNLGLQEQNCLLGIETIVPERCAGIPSELLLTWRVETNNGIVASGDSDATNEGYWGLRMGKVLGSFPSRKGAIYRVQVRIERSSPKLQQTNPGIKIEIRSEDLKWTYVWIGILIQAAAFCFLLALILLLFYFGHRIRARLNSIDR